MRYTAYIYNNSSAAINIIISLYELKITNHLKRPMQKLVK